VFDVQHHFGMLFNMKLSFKSVMEITLSSFFHQ